MKNEGDRQQQNRHGFPSLQQMVFGAAGPNLLISLVLAAFPSLYPCDGPFLRRLESFVTQCALPAYSAELIGIWVVYFALRPSR
jgi:hypothetical protein